MRSIHSAAAMCLRARSARGICEYATSRTRACQNEYSAWSLTDDMRADRTSSLRDELVQARRTTSSSRSPIAATAPVQKTLPTTDSSCSNALRSGAACRGERRSTPGRCLERGCPPSTQLALLGDHALVGQHPDELLGVQRVAARLLEEQFAGFLRGGPPLQKSAASSRAVSSAPSGDSEIVFEFRLPPPQPGWFS